MDKCGEETVWLDKTRVFGDSALRKQHSAGVHTNTAHIQKKVQISGAKDEEIKTECKQKEADAPNLPYTPYFQQIGSHFPDHN